MARNESKMVMGYLPIEERHYDAILSLVAPATPQHRILDPFAGEGAFLEAAANAWRMTPYANELDGERAQACIDRFGVIQALRGDVERLVASNHAFSLGWYNPPYDHDKLARDSKRLEFRYLRHGWKWIQDGGLVLWAVYNTHLTEAASAFLAKNSQSVDVWALPGKHLNEYDQIIVAAVKGHQPDPETLYARIRHLKAHPQPLTVQAEPIYRLPPPPAISRFVFTADIVDAEQGARLITDGGAWQSNGFQALLRVPPPPAELQPVVTPRPGHMALVLAAGVTDGAIIDSETYGRIAIRARTVHVEQFAGKTVEGNINDPENRVTKTTTRLKPTTTLTLLAHDGNRIIMDGDEALLDFIRQHKRALADYLNQRFDPLYTFDFNGIHNFLDRIRLKGKYPLYVAQRHVAAAITKGLQHRDTVLLSGVMGTGKTAMGGAAAIAMASGVIPAFRDTIRDDQVILIVCPPHLTDKWRRELLSISPEAFIQRLDRHEHVREFMEKASEGGDIPKIGIIKRDLTKLGASWEPAVIWRKVGVAQWRPNAEVPNGFTPDQRIKQTRQPFCPHCGILVTHQQRGQTVTASERWLKGGRRTCENCLHPLWQEARNKGAQPKPGEKYPPCPPRYRLDMYLKRHYPDRIALLIWDEIHEAQNSDTGNGEAFGRLCGIADKTLALTGTPFNGRASSLFNLLYHFSPRVRQRYNWGGADRLMPKARGHHFFQDILVYGSDTHGTAESQWVKDMGVLEMVEEEHPTFDPVTGAYTGTTKYQRPYTEAPGISPLLVAEMLDSTIFFSLQDLGKALPDYEEIAVPVDLDDAIAAKHDEIRAKLKDYLVGRRWEGDNSFRGAYLQWSMGWHNAPYRDCEIIHNRRDPITGEVNSHVVAKIEAFDENQVFAKEQALIDLVTAELAENRPCVIYLRQTGTRDIQPRIEQLIRQHVPLAKPFILKNTVAAERREQVIDEQTKLGVNVIITNPELVKTGLDLIAYPSLIFYEIVFNLGTLMQAAARAYRLNQTHEQCKTFYMYAPGTMEATAVQLMSRKQRAAKLLTGETGLTGLDSLTEGEGSFEQALLDAIVREDVLIDPNTLFQEDASGFDADDAAFWNVAAAETDEAAEPVRTSAIPEQAEMRMETPPAPALPQRTEQKDSLQCLIDDVGVYLDAVYLVHHRPTRLTLTAELLITLHEKLKDAETDALQRWLITWLTTHRYVYPGHEEECARMIVAIARSAVGVAPPDKARLEAWEMLRDTRFAADLRKAIRDRMTAEALADGKDRMTADALADSEDRMTAEALADSEDRMTAEPLADSEDRMTRKPRPKRKKVTLDTPPSDSPARNPRPLAARSPAPDRQPTQLSLL